jgi:thiol-disulfide isomerase/thioredoxin
LHKLILPLLILFYNVCSSQCTLTICQICGHKDLWVFYKDGPDVAVGTKVNDSCMVYNIPVSEPTSVALVDQNNKRNIKNIWVNPAAKRDRSATLDNCSNRLIIQDPLSLDIDDAPDKKIEQDFIAGKISIADSFIYYSNVYEEQYINAHPDSFLAAYYLKSLMTHLDLNTAVVYRDMVKKNNSRYSVIKTIDSYLENYKYKSVPNIGDTFFEFRAKEVDGKIFNSNTISNKAIVLFFWYSGCGPCHRVMPALCGLYDKYKSQGLDVISFSLDTREEEWIKQSQVNKIPGINVSDLVGFSSQQFLHYGVTAFPFFVVFDKNKRISMITFGGDEVPLVESKVKELLGMK